MDDPSADSTQVTQRLSAFLFADLVDSVPLSQKDPAGTVRDTEHVRNFGPALASAGLPP